MSFGSRLKKLRTDKHLSQSSLASELGISTNAISQYESDKRFPDKDCIVNICLFFSVSSDYMLGLSDTPYPSSTSDVPLDYKHFTNEQITAINGLISAFRKKDE